MKINNRNIGKEYPPYIIAEMSANHNGSIENAKKIILSAKNAGADAVKLQTYKPDTITLNERSKDFIISDGGLWDGRSLFDLYEEAHMPWEWHKPLFDYAADVSIDIFSSPFDKTAVDLLEDLNAPAYKIASFEVVDLPLIKYVASTKKPMIISTGMANKDEIYDAIEAARDGGCNNIALLHCISSYPANPSDYNLKTITDMEETFKVNVGISDHTISNTTAITSLAFGGCIIEKHFTLDRSGGGPDDSFSLEPDELRDLCESANVAWSSIGRVNYDLSKSETSNIKFRRSLYFINDIKKGSEITELDVASVRPGYGIAPKNFNLIIGKKVSRNILKNTAVQFSDICDL
jgi:pseudaminic acid synthase